MLRFFLAALALLIGGCANVTYYAQAVGGHLQVMNAARSIAEVIDDPAIPPTLRDKLSRAVSIRNFATRELALPENGSYRSYADIGRPYVVWNVFAAGEFSTELERWCLLFVGCVEYRGFYDHQKALRFAARLEEQGLDTHVAPVVAYSTLGYFDDPLLNTFMRFDEDEVARLIFHELAHQRLFVDGDTSFNEAFATVVENEAMRRWLEYLGRPADYARFRQQQSERSAFRELATHYRALLGAIYASTLTAAEKRDAKAETLAAMGHACHSSPCATAATARVFFQATPNNASLGSISLYETLAPAFEALLAESGNDMALFYRSAEAIAKMPPERRRAALAALGKR